MLFAVHVYMQTGNMRQSNDLSLNVLQQFWCDLFRSRASSIGRRIHHYYFLNHAQTAKMS